MKKTLKDKAFCDIHRGIESWPKVFLKDVAEAVKELKEEFDFSKRNLNIKANRDGLIDKIFGKFNHSPHLDDGIESPLVSLIKGLPASNVGDEDKEPEGATCTNSSGSDNPKGCWECDGTGRVMIPCPEKRKGCLVYHTKSCPECQGDICECGHPGSMHGDNEYTHVGECYFQLNLEKKEAMKMRFCGCRKFKQKK